jgi:hypothetical protein
MYAFVLQSQSFTSVSGAGSILLLTIGVAIVAMMFQGEWPSRHELKQRLLIAGIVLSVVVIVFCADLAAFPLYTGCDDPNLSWYEYWMRGCAFLG